MPQVKVGSDLFHVELDGQASAPVLMLSNSLGTNFAMWDPQMPELTKRFHVVRYDSRGHGQSAAPEGPYSIAQLGRDALAIMDDLGFERVHWLGLSKGGMVGQWLLTHAPHRIDRAVLANTAAQAGSPDVWNERIRTVGASGMDAVASAVVQRWFTPDFQKRDPAAVERILAMLQSTPPQGYVACCSAVRDMDQREAIRAVERPVLVIVGSADPATPPEAGALIAEHIAGAELVTLEAAHLSNIEQPEAFTRSVVDFLTRRETPSMRHAVAKAAKKVAKKANKKAAKKSVKTAPKKAAKHAVKKAAKHAVKKAAKKASKKATKKAAKKASKKAVKTVGRKGAKRVVERLAKSAKKTTAKKTGAKTRSFARKAGRPIRGRSR